MNPARAITAMLALVAALALAPPAIAGFTQAQLASISASPPPNAVLPLDLMFRDESGNPTTIRSAIGGVPALAIFADYTCRTLCGPIIEFATAGLAKTGLRPGADYRVLVIGINPHDGINAASAMRANHLDPGNPITQAAIFLTGSDSEIRAAIEAVGLHYAYDTEHDQYAHPAAVYILDSIGRVRRVLSPLGLDGNDLRLAIVDAGNGAVGGFADRIHLLCYGYDPVKGIYTERITAILGSAAGATLVLLLAGIFIMMIRKRRRAAS